MSEETNKAEGPGKQLVDAALMIAKALRDSATPDEALQILAIATGMVLCASANQRGHVEEVLGIFGKQVNLWADFEEEEKTASWLTPH